MELFIFSVHDPFIFDLKAVKSLFFCVLFTNREYNSGNFCINPVFLYTNREQLQNTKSTKYKIFRQLQNTKYKIYFIY